MLRFGYLGRCGPRWGGPPTTLHHSGGLLQYVLPAVPEGFWTEKAAWPQRWRVRLLIGDDRRTSEHLVTTFLGRDKAVALAVAMHVRRHGGHVGVHDVDAEELGPAPEGPDGRPEAAVGDLIDHLEFRG